MAPSTTLEVLDMSLLFSPDHRDEFCASLLDSLKRQGVAKVKNHGIPNETIYSLFGWCHKLFNLSHTDKMAAKYSLTRGYSYVGQENVANIDSDLKTQDIKETYDIGGANDDLFPNIWIAEETLPGFQNFMEDFYSQAFEIELHLLSALARALGCSPSHLQSLHSRAENMCRLLHYPATPVAAFKNGTATRIASHTDFGTITMLFQDSTGGLQVEDPTARGVFHDVESSSPTDLVLNIGDSLQRLTNDTLLAASHRVTLPPTAAGCEDEDIIPERYSVVYLVKPNRDASLLPLTEFVTEATPCRYDDCTYWEWNSLRYKNLYK